MDEVETPGLQVISHTEALRLLGTAQVGRIVFTIRALPAVQPVNFVVDHGAVVIRVGDGSKLAAAVRGNVVAFEADEIDAGTQTGWSVTVTGRCEVVRNADDLARLAVFGPQPWAPGMKDHFIRIYPEIVTGRRIVLPARGDSRTP